MTYRFMLLHDCTDSNAIDMPQNFTRGARRRVTLIVLIFGRDVSIPGQSNVQPGSHDFLYALAQ